MVYSTYLISSMKLQRKNLNFREIRQVKTNLKTSWYSCSFSNNKLIALNGERRDLNGTRYYISIWSTKELREINFRIAHTYWIYRVIYLPKRNILISCSADQTIKLWTANEQFKPLKTYQCSSWIRSLAVNDKEDLLFCGGDHKGIIVCSLRTGKCIMRLPTENYLGHTSMKYISDFNLLIVGCTGKGCLWVYNLRTFKLVSQAEAHRRRKAIWAMEYEPKQHLLFTGSSDAIIKIWKITETFSLVLHREISYGSGNIGQIVSFPEYGVIASSHSMNEVKFWNVETGQSAYTVEIAIAKAWIIHPLKELGIILCLDHASDDMSVIQDAHAYQNSISKGHGGKCQIF